MEDAVEDYYDLLCVASRYRGALNQPTAKKCIEGIIKGGYASEPEYVAHIMDIINQYDLTRFDNGATEWTASTVRPLIRNGSRGDYVKY